MVVGQNVAVLGIDDHARARALHFPSSVRWEEPSEERILGKRIVDRDTALNGNVDHRWCNLVYDGRETGHLLVPHPLGERLSVGRERQQDTSGQTSQPSAGPATVGKYGPIHTLNPSLGLGSAVGPDIRLRFGPRVY